MNEKLLIHENKIPPLWDLKNTKLTDAVDALDGGNAFQRDFNRPEECIQVRPHDVNKAMCKVLYLGQQGNSHEDEYFGERPVDMDFMILTVEKKMSRYSILAAQKVNHIQV